MNEGNGGSRRWELVEADEGDACVIAMTNLTFSVVPFRQYDTPLCIFQDSERQSCKTSRRQEEKKNNN